MSETQTAVMLTEPLEIFIFLLALTGIIFSLSECRPFKPFFHYVSPILFCYFLPMCATTLGILPVASPLYKLVNSMFLPAVLILVLISCDLKAIMSLGWRALGIMLAGTLGVMCGAIFAFFILGGNNALGEWGWACLGALSASWVGGSANMIAVSGALQIPDIAPLLLVDSVLVYTWMGLMVVLAGWQHKADKFFRVSPKLLANLQERVSEFADRKALPITTASLLSILALGFGGGWLCTQIGSQLHTLTIVPLAAKWPEVETFSAFTITIIIVTIVGVLLSMTPLRKLEERGASSVGYALLYLLLPTFGAQADLRVLTGVHMYFAAGMIILLVHALFLIVALWLFKMPLFLGSTASQANLGGAASASVVAAAYQPSMMPIGILFGVLGGILGTYAGLIVASICKMLS